MSNDGRSIGEHLRDTEKAVQPDSSADSSATRQPERGWDQGTGITNRTRSEERENQQRVPPRGDNKDGAHA
jgi:hypothetical protein